MNKKNQKRGRKYIKDHKAMGIIYDNKCLKLFWCRIIMKKIEKKYYTSGNGYGKFFVVDVKQIHLKWVITAVCEKTIDDKTIYCLFRITKARKVVDLMMQHITGGPSSAFFLV
jgi:hypothetical protein